MADYEYDVALSFLAQDERIARRLADVIGDRTRVFVQTAQQRERPDDDVIDTARSVMDAARVCVVLYRDPWGETELTGAEQRALQERAIARGWDFLLVLALASPPERLSPVWVPRANVWPDYERYGAEGAAVVIEHKVREQGGGATEESATERGARLQRQADAEHERDAFLDSERGVEAAQAELARMFAAFRAESDGPGDS